jgi:hypothetical protein
MLRGSSRDFLGVKLVLFFMALFSGLWWLLSTAVDTWVR